MWVYFDLTWKVPQRNRHAYMTTAYSLCLCFKSLFESWGQFLKSMVSRMCGQCPYLQKRIQVLKKLICCILENKKLYSFYFRYLWWEIAISDEIEIAHLNIRSLFPKLLATSKTCWHISNLRDLVKLLHFHQASAMNVYKFDRRDGRVFIYICDHIAFSEIDVSNSIEQFWFFVK